MHGLIRQHPRLVFFHQTRAQQIGQGFPDLVISGPGGTLFRELKMPRGQLKPEQVTWKYNLIAGGEDYAIWLPADYESGLIETELSQVAVYRGKEGA